MIEIGLAILSVVLLLDGIRLRIRFRRFRKQPQLPSWRDLSLVLPDPSDPRWTKEERMIVVGGKEVMNVSCYVLGSIMVRADERQEAIYIGKGYPAIKGGQAKSYRLDVAQEVHQRMVMKSIEGT